MSGAPQPAIPPMATDLFKQAAMILRSADALLLAAGAGMGVDSGLPDFRGNEGFWNAYPPLRRLHLSLQEMAQPEWFVRDPELAWSFYGHRLHLYRSTVPHEGFHILRQMGMLNKKPFLSVMSYSWDRLYAILRLYHCDPAGRSGV